VDVRLSPDFDKNYTFRLTANQQKQVLDTLELFQDEPYNIDLGNHSLGGEWFGHRLISIDGDLRLHFRMIDNHTAYFVAVGNHRQLYR
jgi:mRNA-degrading endonuclease YafQ of YafQ-DinJ toxin-antitoxin module